MCECERNELASRGPKGPFSERLEGHPPAPAPNASRFLRQSTAVVHSELRSRRRSTTILHFGLDGPLHLGRGPPECRVLLLEIVECRRGSGTTIRRIVRHRLRGRYTDTHDGGRLDSRSGFRRWHRGSRSGSRRGSCWLKCGRAWAGPRRPSRGKRAAGCECGLADVRADALIARMRVSNPPNAIASDARVARAVPLAVERALRRHPFSHRGDGMMRAVGVLADSVQAASGPRS